MAGKKLLVADDSLTIQKVIRLALSNEGYDIQTVSDGVDAVQQISVFRPDIILIDVSLPGRTAFEVKKTVNQQSDLSSVKFILMSSAFEKVDEALAAEVRFDGRLTKPFDPAHLRQVLTDVLGRETTPPAPTARKPAAPSAPPSIPKPPSPPAVSAHEDDLQLTDFPSLAPDDESQPESDGATAIWNREIPAPPASYPVEVAPEEEEEEEETDIKHLTESTIRMSGLDDFQWSVNETARKSGLPPLPEFAEDDQQSEGIDLETPPALPPMSGMYDRGGSTFHLEEEERAHHLPPFQMSGNSEPNEVPPSGGMPITESQMEQIIQRQVKETLERIAKEILPEVAERVIKQEIHRMLTEQS